MLSFDEALDALLDAVRPLATERLDVPLADGRVLAEDVHAPADLPPFSASAMDGYALGPEALVGAPPYLLTLHGESRAGHLASPWMPGTARPISTGAELPIGADRVVPREQVSFEGGRLRLDAPSRAGQHVRRRGEDMAHGELALPRGSRLRSASLGLLGALDRARIEVYRRPRVRILCTGDELRAPGSPDRPGSIPDSISAALSAQCRRAGAEVLDTRFTLDRRDQVEEAVASALPGVDLLLTVGGVSVGDHDWVRPALAASGVQLEFWKVAIKPGKPLAFGRASSGACVLGLPGNPVSALLTFALFGAPLLAALSGDAEPRPRALRLPLARALAHKPGRLEFVRARLERASEPPGIVPLENQASGALVSLARTEVLACVPAAQGDVSAGEWLDVLPWPF